MKARPWLLASVPAAALLAVHAALLRPAYVDDQYIFYRYAHNWATGHGPVFNLGEHVEGFSSFLWLVLLTLAELIGAAADDAGPVLTLALGIGCVVLLAHAAGRLLPGSRWAPVVLPLGLALTTGFAYYAASGMDAIAFAFALLGSLLVLSAYAVRAAQGPAGLRWTALAVAALSVLVLVRAEGVVYALVLAAATVAVVPRAARSRALLVPAGAVAVAAVAFAVRQAEFGEWLPATVMAKGYVSHFAAEALLHGGSWAPVRKGLGDGVSYLGAPLLVLSAAVAATGMAELVRRRRPPALVLLGATALAVDYAITVWAAGDWMPFDRQLVPVLPVLLLLSAWSAQVWLGRTRLRERRWVGPAAAALAVAVTVAAVGLSVSQLGEPPPGLYDESKALGDALARSPDPPVVVSHFAGRVAYEAGSRTYVRDIFGLTDIHNAKHGESWVPRFGRTDLAYSLTNFDVLVSPRIDDLDTILALGRSRGEARSPYLLLPGRRFLSLTLNIVVRRGAPARAELEALCRCRGVTLTAEVVRQLRRRRGRAIADRGRALRTGRPATPPIQATARP